MWDYSKDPLLSFELEVFQKAYYDEIEHRENASKKLDATIALLVAYYPILIWLFTKLPMVFHNYSLIIMGIEIAGYIISIICGMIAFQYFILGFIKFKFDRIDPRKNSRIV